jgi:hypothetical protein
LFFLVASASSCVAPEPPPKPLVERDGSCGAIEECASGLCCNAGKCAAPSNEAEEKAVAEIKLERKIARTQKLEKAAYTEQGKQRMRDERAELQEKLAALRGD